MVFRPALCWLAFPVRRVKVMDQELRSSELVPSALDTVPVDGTYEARPKRRVECRRRRRMRSGSHMVTVEIYEQTHDTEM